MTSLRDLPSAIRRFVRVPSALKLSGDDNMAIFSCVTEAEVLTAVTSLSRHKAAGPDGLNNDFYKYTPALLVSALVAISNQILEGADPPPSFLEALIIPLRKKGDSIDAMDYRPISLLQTSYKIFAKVLATRLQRVLPQLIGQSQQGFVHGRQMMKLVMMILAQIATARHDETRAALHSQAILLLDFRKAYDTIDRDFLYAALRSFGLMNVIFSLFIGCMQGRRHHFSSMVSFPSLSPWYRAFGMGAHSPLFFFSWRSSSWGWPFTTLLT